MSQLSPISAKIGKTILAFKGGGDMAQILERLFLVGLRAICWIQWLVYISTNANQSKYVEKPVKIKRWESRKYPSPDWNLSLDLSLNLSQNGAKPKMLKSRLFLSFCKFSQWIWSTYTPCCFVAPPETQFKGSKAPIQNLRHIPPINYFWRSRIFVRWTKSKFSFRKNVCIWAYYKMVQFVLKDLTKKKYTRRFWPNWIQYLRIKRKYPSEN